MFPGQKLWQHVIAGKPHVSSPACLLVPVAVWAGVDLEKSSLLKSETIARLLLLVSCSKSRVSSINFSDTLFLMLWSNREQGRGHLLLGLVYDLGRLKKGHVAKKLASFTSTMR